jgi:hypothetical protein
VIVTDWPATVIAAVREAVLVLAATAYCTAPLFVPGLPATIEIQGT